jgi:hypothetical protein
MRKVAFTLALVLVGAACQDATAPAPVTSASPPRLSISGGDTRCVSALPPGTYGNITVPPGETCVLTTSRVEGNVKALRNSRLVMHNVHVEGNVDGIQVQAIAITAVPLGLGSVGGNIQIKESDVFAPGAGNVFIEINSIEVLTGNIQIEKNAMNEIAINNNSVLKGNVKIEENTVVFVHNIRDNRVAQNVQIFKNRGLPAVTAVQNNFVGADLQCFENSGPFVGGPNSARKAEGQCF